MAVAGGVSFKSISAGAYHTCGLDTADHLWCWGSNLGGQIGNGPTSGWVDHPVQIGSGTWRLVSAGALHTCGLRTDGTLWCWGDNSWGQVGKGTAGADEGLPVPVESPSTWRSVSAGGSSGYQTCAVRNDGTRRCFGRNAQGQLGTGDTISPASPVQADDLTDWATVCLSGDAGCGTDPQGRLRCWGPTSGRGAFRNPF